MKKYLPIALALAALATAGVGPVLAQSADNRTGTFTERNSAAHNYAPNAYAPANQRSQDNYYYPGNY